MKRIPKSKSGPESESSTPLLAFGAHPDDIEFGCGGVIASESAAGRAAHLVVCSRGEAASNGTPAQRIREAKASARILGATVELIDLGGDCHVESISAYAIRLARIIRRQRPRIVLAPTPVANQHPDHSRLGGLVRDAARLARYGGLRELRSLLPHAVEQLFFYAVTPDAEPKDTSPILFDVSNSKTMEAWTAAMEAHVSQSKTRDYVELQLTRARLNGLRAGVGYALALFPNDPMLVDSFSQITGAARRF
jgi:LmbE family N-acetylglucosaminyl deacetylase